MNFFVTKIPLLLINKLKCVNGNLLIELDDVLIRDMSPASDEPNDTVKYRPINLSGNQLPEMNLHIVEKFITNI